MRVFFVAMLLYGAHWVLLRRVEDRLATCRVEQGGVGWAPRLRFVEQRAVGDDILLRAVPEL